MTVEEIRELINLATETGIDELEVQRGDNRVRIRRAVAGHQDLVLAQPVAPPVAPPKAETAAAKEPLKEPGADPNLQLVRSPIVGTFYDASAPGSPPFVRSEEHTSELQSLRHLVCRLLLEKKKYNTTKQTPVHSTVAIPHHRHPRLPR